MTPIGAPSTAPAPDTSIGGAADDALDRPPRSKLGPLVLLLLALLLAAIAVYIVATRDHGTTPPEPRATDAAIVKTDTLLVIEPSPLDAVALPTDAALADAPADAIDHRIRHDARPVRPDAGVSALPDAPTGFGYVTVRTSGDTYNNISIDGDNPVSPPVNKRRLPAGRHTIRFLDPKTGAVVETKTIELKDGDAPIVVH